MRTMFATAILLSILSVLGGARLAVAQSTATEQQMTGNVMPADHFWELIGRTTGHQGDQDAQMEALRYELRKLPAQEIEAFERTFHEQQKRAYSWDLWGAAYIMNGGASDDGFEYFQRWLISAGRKTFEAALADPDSLAGVAEQGSADGFDFELFAYVAGDVWREKTGIDPSTDPQGRFPYTGAPPAPQPSGIPFEEDPDHLAKRYPKLWTKFGQ
jgi:hypothetical protein